MPVDNSLAGANHHHRPRRRLLSDDYHYRQKVALEVHSHRCSKSIQLHAPARRQQRYRHFI